MGVGKPDKIVGAVLSGITADKVVDLRRCKPRSFDIENARNLEVT